MSTLREWAAAIVPLAVAEGKLTRAEGEVVLATLDTVGDEITPLAVVHLWALIRGLQRQDDDEGEDAPDGWRDGVEQRLDALQLTSYESADLWRELAQRVERLEAGSIPAPTPPPTPAPAPEPSPIPKPPPGTSQPGPFVLTADGREWGLGAPVADWNDEIRGPALSGLTAPMQRFEAQIETKLGPTRGLHSLGEWRHGNAKDWKSTFLLLDWNDNAGGRLIATRHYGLPAIEKKVVPCRAAEGDTLKLDVLIEGGWLTVSRDGAPLLREAWSLPDQPGDTYISAGHLGEYRIRKGANKGQLDAETMKAHPSNAGWLLFVHRGRVT